MSDSQHPTTPDVSTSTTPPMLARLTRINSTAVFLGTFALLIGAMLLPEPFSGLLLLILAAGLAALLVTTWPVQLTRTRVLRLIMLTLLTAVALVRIF